MSAFLQILESDEQNGDQLKYKATENDWSSFLKKSGLMNDDIKSNKSSKLITKGNNNESKINKKYAIISIMGPQSSGKSTILNKLFETKFAVMDHTKGRQQVTTGIWIGQSPKTDKILVLDLEGTDSSERKTSRGNFERQTSLMALTLSEILIINMWSNDIGRASGMNVDTLKSIIAANLRLFSPNSKTHLLFLIREQNSDETQPGVTPKSKLKEIITRVITTIFNEIEKPKQYKNTQLKELFDISFFFLPPMVFCRNEFDQKVKLLYDMFTNKNNSDYLFKYDLKKCVPFEGLYTYTKNIFNSISKDESLNIPDQQKLLSAYRCEHAMNEAFKLYQNKTELLAKEVKRRYIDDFGDQLNDAIGDSLDMYNKTANKYDKDEAKEKYEGLVDKIETYIKYLFGYQLKYLISKSMNLYNTEIRKLLSTTKCANNLNSIVIKVGEMVKVYFGKCIDKCKINTDNNTLINSDVYWNDLQDRLKDITSTIQEQQWNLLNKENDALCDEFLISKLEQYLRNPTADTWGKLSLLRIEYHGSILKNNILNKLCNLMYEEQIQNDKVQQIKKSTDDIITARIEKYGSSIEITLQNTFNNLFNKTDKGIPRKWNSQLNIDEIYSKAKDESLKLLEISSIIKLEANNDLELEEIKINLLKSGKMEEIRVKFLKYCDIQYNNTLEKIRRIEQGYGSILPSNPITWGIFLYFAYDDIWKMVKNPFYLMFMIFIGIIIIIIYQINNMGFDVKYAATSLTSGMVKKITNWLYEIYQRQQASIEQHLEELRRQGETIITESDPIKSDRDDDTPIDIGTSRPTD